MANREVLTLVSLTALTLVSIAALVLSPSAAGADIMPAQGLNPNHVPGEKLDSGLGELQPGWTGGTPQDAASRAPAVAPAHIGYRIPGEKLDSGLGELSAYHRSWDNRTRWAPERIVERASR